MRASIPTLVGLTKSRWNMIEAAEHFRQRGRPATGEMPKLHIGFRLAADVVNAIRATGKGYNARVEKVLRDALAKGEL